MALSPELLAIFDAHQVPDSLRAFLLTHKVITPSQFACTAASEDALDSKLILACGLDSTFGERIGIITAWHAARSSMTAAASGPASSRGTPAADTMPDGAEARLRTLWKAKHGFNLNGGWLVSASLMAKIYNGLVSGDQRSLYVADI